PQKDANLKLARAFRVPDVTIGADTTMEGPQGPNTPHQYGFGLSVPLPLFNRNQGGILQAEADLKTAQTDLNKTRLLVEIDVENAYRDFTQTHMLVQIGRAHGLNSSHGSISYAVFCLKKKTTTLTSTTENT